ncbi:hypothetical protein ACP70R_030215 [Stipagrostis hirtigluma subsp. patula]
MARLLRAAALLLLLALSMSAPAAAFAATKGGGGELGALVMRLGGRACRGTVAECMDEFFDLDAEGGDDVVAMATGGGGGKRRVLQGGSGYIGYDALRRDSTPCSQRGASYYNCQPGAEANPYSRGCSAITQCRG